MRDTRVLRTPPAALGMSRGAVTASRWAGLVIQQVGDSSRQITDDATVTPRAANECFDPVLRDCNSACASRQHPPAGPTRRRVPKPLRHALFCFTERKTPDLGTPYSGDIECSEGRCTDPINRFRNNKTLLMVFSLPINRTVARKPTCSDNYPSSGPMAFRLYRMPCRSAA